MWKNVSNSHHTIYFNEFKKFYTWIESDAWIFETFLKHCARQYNRWLSRIKNAKAIRGKPKVISNAGWKLFEEYWELNEQKESCDNGSKPEIRRIQALWGVTFNSLL